MNDGKNMTTQTILLRALERNMQKITSEAKKISQKTKAKDKRKIYGNVYKMRRINEK